MFVSNVLRNTRTTLRIYLKNKLKWYYNNKIKSKYKNKKLRVKIIAHKMSSGNLTFLKNIKNNK